MQTLLLRKLKGDNLNARRKGLRNQRRAKELGENLGYIVHNQPIGGRYNKFKDIFNLWDQIWIRKRDNRIMWVQVKSNNFPSIRKYQKWCWKHEQYGLIMTWVDRDCWNIRLLSPVKNSRKVYSAELRYV